MPFVLLKTGKKPVLGDAKYRTWSEASIRSWQRNSYKKDSLTFRNTTTKRTRTVHGEN
jgi:hypothetical protein